VGTWPIEGMALTADLGIVICWPVTFVFMLRCARQLHIMLSPRRDEEYVYEIRADPLIKDEINPSVSELSVAMFTFFGLCLRDRVLSRPRSLSVTNARAHVRP
jgi:hypothetical protein